MRKRELDSRNYSSILKDIKNIITKARYRVFTALNTEMLNAYFEIGRKIVEEEQKGKKHKGLLVIEPSSKKAEEYLDKARDSLRFCDIYKKAGSDYKIPEEWYTFVKHNKCKELLSY